MSLPQGRLEELLQELETRIQGQERAISELIQVYEENGDEHQALRDHIMTLRQGQQYLENLWDQTAAEIDLLKKDMHLMTRSLQQLQSDVTDLKEQSPKLTMSMDNRISTAHRHSSIPPEQRRLLSTIPPRHLNEQEALSLLQAVDRIVNGKDTIPPDR